MTGFGAISPQAYTLQKVLPQRGSNVYRSGIKEGERGYEIYAQPSSTNPILMISNPVCDDDRNVIVPGYYELILSDDRTMLTLAQAGQSIAVIPVFKIEEDKSQDVAPPPMDNKAQKKFDKEQKKAEKKRKKQIRRGEIPNETPEIYTNATIEYNEKGDYYLIKYERGRIRAWGAIK